jgi:hypothetical protein
MGHLCEIEYMEYMGEDSIDLNRIPNICHRPFIDPVCTPCDHAYGHGCTTKWLDQLRVRCRLCEDTGLQRGNFNDHINKGCPKAALQYQAADIKCPWKGLRDELQNCASVCFFEPLRRILTTLITENRQLIDQVRKHDNEITVLTKECLN